MKPEILSPAGSMESFYAALEAGADAIYLGGLSFGARAYSKNFSMDEMKTAINYAHLYGVKVYVTVNTLIYDDEVDDFIKYVKDLHKIGVDAIIMQDIGMIDLVRKTLPNLEIHVSTQAHIHNLDGAKFLEKLGIKRTVLARETSIDEIENISKNSHIDLEVFVAGALCISYSGNCLMSSLIGGRSGNRGMCAGFCRLPYDLVDEKGKVINKDKYVLSTKDLSTLDNIGKLIDLGIKSFKIEGRMKSPEYVYVITSLYRKAVDSYFEKGKVEITDTDIKKLKKVFTRGFTKGFIFNEDNSNFINPVRPNHQGIEIGKVIDYKNGKAKIKLDDDLSINDGVRISDDGFIVTSILKNGDHVKEAFKGDTVIINSTLASKGSAILKTKDYKLSEEINKLILSKQRKVKIDMIFKAREGFMSLDLICDDKLIKVESNAPQISKNISATKDDVLKQLSKLGDTPYIIDKIDIDMDNNLFINVKDLNALRRDAIDKLNNERLKIKEYIEKPYNIDLPDFKYEKNINYKVNSLDIYNKLKNYNDIYVDDIDLYNKITSYYIIPRVNIEYKDYDKVMINDICALNRFKSIAGPYMNVVNSYAVAFLHSMGVKRVCLSYEMDYDKIKTLIDNYHKRYKNHPNLEVVCYGRIEAMISKFNLLEYYNLEDGNYYLASKFKNKYPIKIRDGKMIVYYDGLITDKNNYFDIGINNIRLDIDDINDLNRIEEIILNI